MTGTQRHASRSDRMAVLLTTSARRVHGGAAGRARHAPAHGRHRQRAAARRPRHALGRPRRRQDHVRARADPLSGGRSVDRGAEPDLHADADLRPAAVSGGACRSLPPVGAGELAELGFDDLPERRRRPARMAGPRRRIPAARPARHHAHARAQAQARIPPRPRHRLRHVRAARRPHRAGAPVHRRAAATATPCARASRAMPRRGPTSGSRSATSAHPDELAARGPTARRSATASRTARSRISPKTSRRSWRMANGLRERGFSAPAILHADLAQGLLFIEDLGDERVVAGDPPAPIQERYESRGRRAGRAARQQSARRAAGLAARRIPHSALRHRCVPDRSRAAARLVSAALRRRGAGREREQFRALWRERAAAGDRIAADLGAARLPFAQSALAAASARASRGSASWISRTR